MVSRRLIVFFIVLAVSVDKVSSFTINDCPSIEGINNLDGYTKVFQDSCFRFYLFKERDFSEAQAECARGGGTLALIKSKDVQNFILNELTNTFIFTQEVWIGLQDRRLDDVYMWEDGTRLLEGDFSNWGSLEGPGHIVQTVGDVEDCVTLDPMDRGKWKDVWCKRTMFSFLLYKDRSFVCQYQIGLSQGSTVSTTERSTTTNQVQDTNTTQVSTVQVSTTVQLNSTNEPVTTSVLDLNTTQTLNASTAATA